MYMYAQWTNNGNQSRIHNLRHNKPELNLLSGSISVGVENENVINNNSNNDNDTFRIRTLSIIGKQPFNRFCWNLWGRRPLPRHVKSFHITSHQIIDHFYAESDTCRSTMNRFQVSIILMVAWFFLQHSMPPIGPFLWLRLCSQLLPERGQMLRWATELSRQVLHEDRDPKRRGLAVMWLGRRECLHQWPAEARWLHTGEWDHHLLLSKGLLQWGSESGKQSHSPL